jgi:hypothetical protein
MLAQAGKEYFSRPLTVFATGVHRLVASSGQQPPPYPAGSTQGVLSLAKKYGAASMDDAGVREQALLR